MKSVDWKDFVQYHEPYVMSDVLAPADQMVWDGVLGIIRELLEAESPAFASSDVEAAEWARLLKDRVCVAFAALDTWPHLVYSAKAHVFVHVPAMIARWNNVRNYWAFFNERFIGWLKNMIADRARPTSNMVSAYARYTMWSLFALIYILMVYIPFKQYIYHLKVYIPFKGVIRWYISHLYRIYSFCMVYILIRWYIYHF